jgi:hypothetical protein
MPSHVRVNDRQRRQRQSGGRAPVGIAGYSRPVQAGPTQQPDVTATATPLGVGSLAANLVAQAAAVIVLLARETGDGCSAAQAQRIARRAGVLSASNDVAFTAAIDQLAATATGSSDGYLLTLALGDAAALPRVICETAADLALLAAELASSGDSARRADYIGIAQLAAAAAETSALLVRTNLTISDDDWRLTSAMTAATHASEAARRAELAD